MTEHAEQTEWAVKADQVLSKPANKITQDDAKEVESREARLPSQWSIKSANEVDTGV